MVALLAGVWGVAVVGIVLKLFFPGRFDRLAIVLYLAMGWSGVMVYDVIADALPTLAMWLLAMMAGLADVPRVGRTALRFWLVAGPLVFIAVGFCGAVLADAFLGYPEGRAKLWIVAIEFALMPSLALTLGLLLAGAPHRALQK